MLCIQDILGYCAAFCTTVAFLPQVIQVWRTRSVRDISFGMYSIFCTGVILWLVYGWLVSSWPLLLANGMTFLLAFSILILKWKGSKKTG